MSKRDPVTELPESCLILYKLSIRNKFVRPDDPKGAPAVITASSPLLLKFFSNNVSQTIVAISSKSLGSRVTILFVPHTNAKNLAVVMDVVKATKVDDGRCCAIDIDVDPLVVKLAIQGQFNVVAISLTAPLIEIFF